MSYLGCTVDFVLQGKAYVGCGRGKNVDLGDGYDTDDSFIDNDEAVSLYWLSFIC